MAAKKSWIKILAGLGCLGIIMAGCAIGLLIFLFSGSDKLKPLELDVWAEYIGRNNPTDLPHCTTKWTTSADKTQIVCDELRHQLPFARAEKTGATVHLDPKKNVRSIEFKLHGTELYVISKDEKTTHANTWNNAAITAIHAKECPKTHFPFSTVYIWQCDQIAYGIASPIHDSIDNSGLPTDVKGYLWIAKKSADFEPHANQRGQYISQQKAALQLMVADIYIEQKDYGMADSTLILAAYFSLQGMNTKKPSALTQKTLKDVARKRIQIHTQASQQRKKQELAPTPPADTGLIDLPFLMNKTQADMEILFGKPTTCKTMNMASTGPFPRCTYGDNIWKAEISFINKLSSRITLTFHHSLLDFDESALAKLQIQIVAPTKSTSKTLTWKKIANLKELTIEKPNPKQIVVTTHTR